jgi:hypothetical protein
MARRGRWYVDLFKDVYPDRWFEERAASSSASSTVTGSLGSPLAAEKVG